MQLNSFNVDGRLTTKVFYSITKNGIPMSRWSYANDRDKHTNFFQCIAWNQTAKYANNYLQKGQKVAISGEMQHTIMPNGKEYYQIIVHTLDPDRERSSVSSGGSTTLRREARQRAQHNAKRINKEVTNAMKFIPKNKPNHKY